MTTRAKLTGVFVPAMLAAVILSVGGTGRAAPGDYKTDKRGKPAAAPVRVSSAPMDHVALAAFIDRTIDDKMKAEGAIPSRQADDSEFLRRAYLDVTGHIPSAEKAAAFLDSKDPNKRARLIDELLAGPDYGRHQADIWQALLIPRITENRRLDVEPLVGWLAQNFNRNRPWNMMVRDLLTASGDQSANGAVTFYIANGTVDKMTDEVTKLFLGVQLQCAQCHNHPFTDWKQTEYWGMAAFFMKVQAPPANKVAKNGNAAVEERDDPRRGKNALPESTKHVPPKFLAGEEPRVGSSGPLRPVLADWLTTAENPYFGKAMVNRTWAQYFGRGIVNPVDDLNDDNPASHPALLPELANQFARNDFDIKYLIRAMCNSRAYQRTSKPAGTNGGALPNAYAHMTVKVLTPEQLFDSLAEVLGRPDPRLAEGRKAGGKGKNPQAGDPRAVFVNFFGVNETAGPTQYQAGIPQALNLMNSPRINLALQSNPVVRSGKPAAEVIERLFLSTVSRRPTGHEVARLTAHVRKAGDPATGYGDVLWALLNSTEFTLNH